MMVRTETKTFRIWIAGDVHDAIRCVKEWCDKKGDCYTVTEVDYVYSGGHEKGVCVTRINYARFPEKEQTLRERVEKLGEFLAERLFQKSFSIETPSATYWFQRSLPCKGEEQ